MKFKKLVIKKWQQFENAELHFHERLTVLTGANGSGKTTLLNILAKHSGWNVLSLATPEKDKIKKIWKWVTGLFTEKEINSQNIIGEIIYSDGKKASLTIPDQKSAQYEIRINNQQEIECFFIPSHRPVFRYESVNTIQTQGIIGKKQAFNKVSGSNRALYFGGKNPSNSFHIKETLISWNIFGRGNIDMEPNEKLLEYYEGFEGILKIVIPKEIGFNRFAIKNFEVVLECDSGNFIIDAVSGGISAIIDITWQIFMYSTGKGASFSVLIDEIENHLHPTMQRRILPDLVKAFPNVSFIVSTHNPLIVGSVKDSEVYILVFNENRKVVAQRLDLINKAKTAAEILDEVLGVSSTMPVWAEEELNGIVNKYMKMDIINKGVFQKMRTELSEMGLEKLIPNAIIDLIENK